VSKKSNTSKRYTDEYKRDAVELVRSSGRTPTDVARELGVSSESLRGWVNQAKADRGEGAPGALTTDEKDELRRLRRENAQLRTEKEILKKAAAFFAKEMK
jgi:transposase